MLIIYWLIVVLYFLIKDYFSGDNSTYSKKDFRRRFRMRQEVFERVRIAVMKHDSYFQQKVDRAGRLGASSHTKVTAALRMLAYGTSADQLDDYIRLAESTILDCLKNFCVAVCEVFGAEYLRTPDENDLKVILAASAKSGFNGCLGSLDVMKWEWKNCPIAWRGSFKSGKDAYPTIALEAAVDFRLYFWHVFFGIPGSQNDINILDQSNMFDQLAQGLAPEVKFVVNNKLYDTGYYLTDGIYPPWAILMQTINKPEGRKQQLFAKLQEAKRKEVERGFGVLQARFRILSVPCKLWNKDAMSCVMQACVILHNMIVDDEYNKEEMTQEYLFENGDGTKFIVDKLIRSEDDITFSKIMANRAKLKDNKRHAELKNDLIEHLWTVAGSG